MNAITNNSFFGRTRPRNLLTTLSEGWCILEYGFQGKRPFLDGKVLWASEPQPSLESSDGILEFSSNFVQSFTNMYYITMHYSVCMIFSFMIAEIVS